MTTPKTADVFMADGTLLVNDLPRCTRVTYGCMHRESGHVSETSALFVTESAALRVFARWNSHEPQVWVYWPLKVEREP